MCLLLLRFVESAASWLIMQLDCKPIALCLFQDISLFPISRVTRSFWLHPNRWWLPFRHSSSTIHVVAMATSQISFIRIDHLMFFPLVLPYLKQPRMRNCWLHVTFLPVKPAWKPSTSGQQLFQTVHPLVITLWKWESPILSGKKHLKIDVEGKSQGFPGRTLMAEPARKAWTQKALPANF